MPGLSRLENEATPTWIQRPSLSRQVSGPPLSPLKVQGFTFYYISFYMFCEAKDLQQLVSTRKSDNMPCKSLSRCRDNLRRLFSQYRKYRISVRRIFSHRPEVKRCEHWRTLLNLCQDKKEKEKNIDTSTRPSGFFLKKNMICRQQIIKQTNHVHDNINRI